MAFHSTSLISRIALLIVALTTSVQAEPPASSVEMVDASHVRLLPRSPFHDRQELHRTGYVGHLNPDRLLFEYRKLAGLPQPAGITAGYGGWDGGFIKGHMAGHYLSAASCMAAATSDESLLLGSLVSAAEQRVRSPDGKRALVVSAATGLRYRVEQEVSLDALRAKGWGWTLREFADGGATRSMHFSIPLS